MRSRACAKLSGSPRKRVARRVRSIAHRIRAEIQRRQMHMRRPAIVATARARKHHRAIGGEQQFRERAGKAASRLDQRDQAARGHVDALQHALPVQPDLAHQPVVLVRLQQFVDGQHRRRHRLRSAARSVPASARSAADAASRHPVRAPRQAARTMRPPRGCPPRRPATCDRPSTVIAARRPARSNATRTCEYATPSSDETALQRRQRDALAHPSAGPTPPPAPAHVHAASPPTPTAAPLRPPAAIRRARRPRTPSSVVQNTSARSRRTIRLSVSRVSPPVPGSTASSGSSGNATPERRSSISMMCVGRHRQLVPAAGGTAAHRRQPALAGIRAGVLDGEARLVGELAEVHLVAVRGLGEHADVGAGAEHALLAGAQHHAARPRDVRSAGAAPHRPARYRRRGRRNSASARSPRTGRQPDRRPWSASPPVRRTPAASGDSGPDRSGSRSCRRFHQHTPHERHDRIQGCLLCFEMRRIGGRRDQPRLHRTSRRAFQHAKLLHHEKCAAISTMPKHAGSRIAPA